MEIKKGDPIAWYCSYNSGEGPRQYMLADYGTVIDCSAYEIRVRWTGLNGGGNYVDTHAVKKYNINFRYDKAEARNRKIDDILNK